MCGVWIVFALVVIEGPLDGTSPIRRRFLLDGAVVGDVDVLINCKAGPVNVDQTDGF